MTIGLDYSGAAFVSYKRDIKNLSSGLFYVVRLADMAAVKCQGAIAALNAQTRSARCAIAHQMRPAPRRIDADPSHLAPACDRSGGAADAVRDRALFSPRPDAKACACASAPRLSAPLPLTPARCGAKKLVRQFPGPIGAGCGVPVGTSAEPWRNLQCIDIAALFVRFQQFQPAPRVHVRAAARTRTRTCEALQITGTLELHRNIEVIQRFSGSGAVPARFQMEPASPGTGKNGGILPFLNKVGLGYSPMAGSVIAGASISTVTGGGVAKSFGLRAGGGARIGARIGAARRSGGGSGSMPVPSSASGSGGGNGGFLPFLRLGSDHVGRPMLEGMAERRGNAGISNSRHQPSRLRNRSASRGVVFALAQVGGPIWTALPGGRGGLARRAAPPVPPSRPRPSPSSLAQAIFSDRIGLRPADPIRGDLRRLAGSRESLGRMIGSGLGHSLNQREGRAAVPGWGEVADIPQRRSVQGKTGLADVN